MGFEPGLEGARGGDPSLPLSIHLAEGTTPEDADEIRKLADLGLLDDRMIAVHVVGADPDGIRRLREARVAIVWCPTSNEFLFGRSVSPELLASGVDVLLGSDSLLTADGTLLDELRAARAHRVLDDGELLDAVGNVAARRLDLPRPELSPQAPADLAYFAKPVLQATATDVELVVVAGLPRLADERFGDLFACAGVKTEPLRVGATDKLVAAPLASVAGRVLGRCPAAPFWTSVRQRLP